MTTGRIISGKDSLVAFIMKDIITDARKLWYLESDRDCAQIVLSRGSGWCRCDVCGCRVSVQEMGWFDISGWLQHKLSCRLLQYVLVLDRSCCSLLNRSHLFEEYMLTS